MALKIGTNDVTSVREDYYNKHKNDAYISLSTRLHNKVPCALSLLQLPIVKTN